jgi:prefoldin subunit 5
MLGKTRGLLNLTLLVRVNSNLAVRIALVDRVRGVKRDQLQRALESIKQQLDVLRESVEEIKKLAGYFKPLAELYEKFKGCTEEYTYVYNKQRKQYYYWYLKCPGKNPSSIYLGSSREGYNIVKNSARSAEEFIAAVEIFTKAYRNLADAITQLERAIETFKLLESEKKHSE